MRTFTRHPANVPIEIAMHPVASEDDYATVDAEFEVVNPGSGKPPTTTESGADEPQPTRRLGNPWDRQS